MLVYGRKSSERYPVFVYNRPLERLTSVVSRLMKILNYYFMAMKIESNMLRTLVADHKHNRAKYQLSTLAKYF